MYEVMDAGNVIDALGGTGAVARICGVRSSAVSNWRRIGKFPPRVRIPLEDAYGGLGNGMLDRELFAEVGNAERGAA
jgi:hypothetical protein